MKKNYLVAAFEETLARDFPAQARALKLAFETRLAHLRRENAGASREKQRHLEGQILPGIAIYETLQTVLPKEAALAAVHGYVEKRAWKLKAVFLKLMRLPGLYRKVPGIFSKQTPKLFGRRRALPPGKYRPPAACGAWICCDAPITTPACNTAVRSCVPASATATTLPTTACIPICTGTERRPWAGATTAAIFA